MDRPQILDGVKVVAFETSVSGPFSSVLLSDFGAEVTKIEMPKTGDIARHWDSVAKGLSSYFVCLNRNKKSLELDIKSKEDMEVLLNLLREADVFIVNFRPEAIERIGLTYDKLNKINPRLIYCGISGWGKNGAYKNQPAYDLLIQAESGLISVTGYEEAPAKVGVSICDLITGLYSAYAVSLALIQREKTGKGCEIDMSMFECALSLLLAYPMYYMYRGKSPKRLGMKHSLIAPSGAYKTKDGKFVVLSIDKDDEWERLCKQVLDRQDLLERQSFVTNEKRLTNRGDLEQELDTIFLTQDQGYWLNRLRSAKIASGRVNGMREVLDHVQVRDRDFLSSVETENGEVKFFGNPVRIEGFPALTKAVPKLGDNNKLIRETAREKKSGSTARTDPSFSP
jgi:crotonobetainyl-CoA:carnitine CoA-transferase CaiB-like acyl-CoA transferase